jgi:ribosome biogenesis GTPase / thiamine phosphate phosphatase
MEKESSYTGIVEKSTGSWYRVRTESGQAFNCTIKGKFRLAGIKSTNPVAVGDKVDIVLEADGAGVINRIHTRRNYIIRRSSNLSRESHVLASNIDQAFIIVTVRSPRTLTNFIDRFLVTAEAYSIDAVIIVNKTDLLDEAGSAELESWRSMYQGCGYRLETASAVTGAGVSTLKEMLAGKLTLLAGNSGVGKSSLVNCIDPALNLKTKEVSRSHKKGQHTTTFAELFPLAFGGYVIDSPGVKAFGLLDMDKDNISHYFPEMRRLMQHCQYSNCSHLHEPGCAVMQGLASGIIHPVRYQSYVAMVEDANEKHRKAH